MSKSVVLVWKDPSTRADGSVLSQEAISHVLVEMSAGAEFAELGQVPSGVQTFTQTDLPDGSYEFRLTVVDKQTPARKSSSVSVFTVVLTVLAEPSPVLEAVATVV